MTIGAAAVLALTKLKDWLIANKLHGFMYFSLQESKGLALPAHLYPDKEFWACFFLHIKYPFICFVEIEKEIG